MPVNNNAQKGALFYYRQGTPLTLKISPCNALKPAKALASRQYGSPIMELSATTRHHTDFRTIAPAWYPVFDYC